MEYCSKLVGNQPIQRYLQKTIKNGTVANAQLWLGPKHIGKSTFLINYIFALSCQRPSHADKPCQSCSVCKALQDEHYPNLRWVDAADKAIRVDSILEIRGNSSHTTLYPGPRVLVIENADQLHPTGSNALLKLLEEPTAGLYIFLLSSSPDIILTTIRSRCLVLNFSLAAPADVLASWSEVSLATIAITQGLPGRIKLFQQQPKLAAAWLKDIKNWLEILAATSYSQRIQLAQPWLVNEKSGQASLLNILRSASILLRDILQIQNENVSKVLLAQYTSELEEIANKHSLAQTIYALSQIQVIWKRQSTTPIQKKLVLSNFLLVI
ncbi:MAG: hypothetical protein ACD_43C00279G0003 [uncultured bacterium]|nr:MAG: hypothetical protein ACD_43C00279G0003 [uncultured bacterium]